MRAPRWLPRPAALAITFMIAITLLVPASYLAAPAIQRRMLIGDLTADDPADRARAHAYLLRTAATDPRIMAGAIRTLRAGDDATFLQVAETLERASLWTRRHVPDDVWLRWLTMLAERGDADARIFAAQRLGDLAHLADDPRLPRLLTELAGGEEPDARYNALVNAAALAGEARDPSPYVEIVRGRTGDAEPHVARHAWILLGVLGSAPLPPIDWQTAPPTVVEAMLWAHAAVHPEEIGPLLSALTAADADPRVRAAATYALGFSTDPRAEAALLAAAAVPPENINERNQLMVWRAILGLPKPNLQQKQLGRLEEVVMAPAYDESGNPLVEPIALAAVYRLGIAGVRLRTDSPEADRARDALVKLATVEGQEPPYMEWPLTVEKPPLLRVLTVRVSKNPHIGNLRPAFESELATIRDLAAVVAAKQFPEDKLSGMTESLLKDYNDYAKMSGAILSGLTGVQTELLRKRMLAEDLWVARQIEALGLWMQGALPELDGRVTDLLLRDEIPPTTVLLAMLHRGQRITALDWLLNPRGEPPIDLVQLFDQHRWWYVLEGYLPDAPFPAGPPPFWVWGDPELQALQVDILRDWYLVRRPRLRGE